MNETISRLKREIDGLSEEDKKEILRHLNNKRVYNKNYQEVAENVKSHIIKHGHITTKQAYENGYTTKLLDTTTFNRCIVSKISMDIGRRRLKNRSIAFYDKKRGPPLDFDNVGEDLVDNIVSQIDLRRKRNDLMPLLDRKKYPALKKRGSLKKIHPMLVKAMGAKGYELIDNKLTFERGG